MIPKHYFKFYKEEFIMYLKNNNKEKITKIEKQTFTDVYEILNIVATS